MSSVRETAGIGKVSLLIPGFVANALESFRSLELL